MTQPPAFQLYAADFYMDTITWSNEEVGIYNRLLWVQWINGPLPNDDNELKGITKTTDKKWSKTWPKIGKKFVDNGNGGLINLRLEKQRETQLQYQQSQSESGKRGVEAKKKRGIYPFNKSSDPSSTASSDPTSNPPSERQALQSSSSSSKDIKKRKNIKKEILTEIQQKSFDLFWKAYPYKKSKGDAEKAWKKINPDPELLATMILKIEKAKSSVKWIKDNGEFIPYPATWLNAKGWEDEDVEIVGGERQGTRMACKQCGDSGQYAGIDENGVCAKCRTKGK